MGETLLGRRTFAAASRRARASGQVVSLTWAQTIGSFTEWADGDLRGCSALAEEAKALGSLCANPYAMAGGCAMCALVLAAQDDEDGCARETAWGASLLEMVEVSWVEGVFFGAQGLLALNGGDLPTAEAMLKKARLSQALPMFRPINSDHDLAEVLVRLGRREEAASLVATLPAHGALAPRARRSLALVSNDQEATGLFEEALRLHEQHTSRLEHGRTHLLYGERLRRAGKRSEGRGHLETALRMLEGLGAEGFAKRARAELRASGVRARPHAPASRDELTGQERQVAQEVALGRSNREVAAALFLSPKTVEMHLTRVYRKLGLRSRAELVRLVAHGGLDGATEEPPVADG